MYYELTKYSKSGVAESKYESCDRLRAMGVA